MKKGLIVTLIIVLVVSLFSGCSSSLATDNGKRAILVVSFGTSYNDSRALTIEATENRIKDEFPDYDIFRAFTSQIIIDKLKNRDNLDINNVLQAMEQLKKDKYSEVYIQPLHVINGEEYNDLLNQANNYKDSFNTLRIGKPLLSSTEDYQKAIDALKDKFSNLEKNEAVVFMGHGTPHIANAQYSELSYMLHDEGYSNVFVGTVEGYPTIDNVISRLNEKNIEKVTLMPFMLVAGDHANNDMAGDESDSWKTILKKDGFEVTTYIHGLGEVKGIQDLYVEHLRNLIDGLYEPEENK
ncbi:sirohydrochlorin cobaltochelatase [Helicovermis profundi]|uniref:Sirohydrochlorin cobaltochelatase n=1 Tax=Helicovermis profundi TaxID=3065157 RepID=A0AAU9E151_9FIRM|nr:hypothetical protein HLPR_06220 [Clostridia bacterium S502]